MVHRALSGFILDAETGLGLGGALINVASINHSVSSAYPNGDFWRLFPKSGIFQVWVTRDGYFDSDPVTLDTSELPYVSSAQTNRLNFTLWPTHSARFKKWSSIFDFNLTENMQPVYTLAMDDLGANRTSTDGVSRTNVAILESALVNLKNLSIFTSAGKLRAFPSRVKVNSHIILLLELFHFLLVSTALFIFQFYII
ncbi:unnamed protein product [Protopolystoma xenopodis]|uniref:Uncharacterized protein n=1 Tax=Protopolystoma xenopodis TaxID=117903 RepID=A0A3S5A216_9PLAT|nr:unnamed protein product [Protopolystoma xenopodis]